MDYCEWKKVKSAKTECKALPAFRPLVLVAGLAVLAVGLWAARNTVLDEFSRAPVWLRSLGPYAPLAFVLLYIVSCLAGVPGTPLTLAAGWLFGLLWGTVWVSLASTLGATGAFLVSRYVARGAVSRWVTRYPRADAIDKALAEQGVFAVLLLRLSPVLPFNVLNYLLGVTRISLPAYVLGSWVGMLPGTFMYVYAGSLLREIGDAAVGQQAPHALRIVAALVGFVATVAVTLLVTRRARTIFTGSASQTTTQTSDENEAAAARS